MMSISNVSAGAAASGYYKEEGYYKSGTGEGERSASWFGKAAEEAGLKGFVDDKQFAELLEGQAPDGKLMGRYVDGERQHRPGLDLTFSASKSASVAALVIGDSRIVEAHDAAVRTAMGITEERFIKTRYQENGSITTANGEGLIAGIFRHDTSRALDPNLHSHAVIANMVKNPNGSYSALSNEEVFRNRKVITEVYRSDFEARMKDLGIETSRGRYGEVNIAGIPQEVVDGFSKRRQEIVEALDKKGVEYSADNASKAALATRAVKHKNLDRDALRDTWHKEAREFGLSQDQLNRGLVGPEQAEPRDQANVLRAEPRRAEPSVQEKPDQIGTAILDWMKGLIGARPTAQPEQAESREGQAVSQAIAHVSERHSVYTRTDLTTAALQFSGGAQLKDIDREIESRIASGGLFAQGRHGETLTDRASVALEGSIIKTWRQSEQSSGLDLDHRRSPMKEAELVNALQAETGLSSGQREALETSLTGPGRYAGIQGYAGTGKTHMVQKLTTHAEQLGYDVKIFAPTLQAVQEVQSVASEARTLASVLVSERNHPAQVDNSKSILLVDESSMVSAKDMRTFMDYAERTGAARVVFAGDVQQHDAISAGQPFAQLQQAGMRTAVMDEIVRQRDGDLKEAVYHSIRGEISEAFGKLAENVVETDKPRQEAAGRYLSLSPEEREETRILTLTNAAREEVNAAIREGLRAEGSLSREGLQVSTLSAQSMTEVQRGRAESYEPGTVVQSLISNKAYGLEKNQLYTVTSSDPRSNQITVSTAGGEDLVLPLDYQAQSRALGSSIVAYSAGTRELSEGDLIRARITDSAQGITNGDRARITGLGDGGISAVTADGRELQFPADSLAARGLEHDYASTSHSVQGASVKRVIAAMSASEQLATQKAFYVEISRATDQAILVTDNARNLSRNISENTGERPQALDARLNSAFEKRESEFSIAVDWAISHLSERSPVYERTDVLIEAMKISSQSNPDAIDHEIDKRIENGDLFASGKNNNTLTDKASVALESSILMTMHAGRNSGGVELQSHGGRDGPAALQKRLSDAKSLTDGQRSAIETSLTGESRYVGVQGYAGTGKTFMVDRLSHYAAQSGYEVKGYAPSHQAVDELTSVLGSAETLAKVITIERHNPENIDNRKSILLVDEASMISAQDMRSFMNFAERTGAARVVFVGDTQQLDAVAAGQPFDQLLEAGMPLAIMDEIRRQRDGNLKQAVLHSIRGEISSAFDRLGQSVQLSEDVNQDAAKAYLQLSSAERAEARVLTLTNMNRKEISAEIRSGLQKEGVVGTDSIEVTGLTNNQLTRAQLSDARSYGPGDVVVPVASSRTHGLQKDELYVVKESSFKLNRLTVQHEKSGETVLIPLSEKYNRQDLGQALVSYDREKREFSEGDQVRFRITDKNSGITNGQRGQITSIEDGRIEVETKDGNRHEVDPSTLAGRGLELDYAATAHAVQGETLDRVIVAMHASEKLVSQKSFYVEISRARDEVKLLTNDPEDLAKALKEQTGERPLALEAWLESQRTGERQEERDDRTGKDSGQQPEKETEAKTKAIEEKDKDTLAPLQLGLFDERIQEIEKQAELVRQREIER